eukprot:3935833-Rhodomonas_salina.4
MFVSWDRIRRIESVGSNGTICLASGLTPEKVRRPHQLKTFSAPATIWGGVRCAGKGLIRVGGGQVKADCEAWTAQHIAANGNLGVVAADFEAWADSILNSRRSLTQRGLLVMILGPRPVVVEKSEC